jgi:enediyne biosynthesis protein E3
MIAAAGASFALSISAGGSISMTSTASVAGAPFRVRLRTRLLSLSPRDTTFEAFDFHRGDPAAQAALEEHASYFGSGFNAALAAVDVAALEQPLASVAPVHRGFAYEGAGMALAVLDMIAPGSRGRLAELLRTHGAPYTHTIHAGAGWALARFRLRPRKHLPALDPLLRSMAIDGYGFHEAAFHTRRYVTKQAPHRRVTGQDRRAFDQGLGRALWFVECADVERAAHTIGGFDEARRGDLWSGVGVAAAYSVTVGEADLRQLGELAGRHRLEVALGAAMAAAIRRHAGNVVEHTRMAAETLCERGVDEIGEVVEAARAGLGPDAGSYERWRARVRDWLAAPVRSVA